MDHSGSLGVSASSKGPDTTFIKRIISGIILCFIIYVTYKFLTKNTPRHGNDGNHVNNGGNSLRDSSANNRNNVNSNTVEQRIQSTQNRDAVQNLNPTSSIYRAVLGNILQPTSEAPNKALVKIPKQHKRKPEELPSSFYLTSRATSEEHFPFSNLTAPEAHDYTVGKAFGVYDPRPKVIITLNNILCIKTMAQVQVGGVLTNVDGFEVIPSAVSILQKLARYCNLYVIALCKNEEDEQSYMDILQNEGIFDYGLMKHKALFCTSSAGLKAICRQIEPTFLAISYKDINKELKQFIDDIVLIEPSNELIQSLQNDSFPTYFETTSKSSPNVTTLPNRQENSSVSYSSLSEYFAEN